MDFHLPSEAQCFPLFSTTAGSLQGEYQRKLYKELMENYTRLERPVLNDSAPILVELGMTLLQIIDVVSWSRPGAVASLT
ncbi:neuronal acetylcholine receptor subunit alpha-7-like [Arapaima gigas]